MPESNRPEHVPANLDENAADEARQGSRRSEAAAAAPSDTSPEDWLDRLLELESAKQRALMTFDPDLYEASAREQSQLVESGVPDLGRLPRERARSFALNARLNSALLLNLFSISPHFALAVQAYGPSGAVSETPPASETLRMEA